MYLVCPILSLSTPGWWLRDFPLVLVSSSFARSLPNEYRCPAPHIRSAFLTGCAVIVGDTGTLFPSNSALAARVIRSVPSPLTLLSGACADLSRRRVLAWGRRDTAHARQLATGPDYVTPLWSVRIRPESLYIGTLCCLLLCGHSTGLCIDRTTQPCLFSLIHPRVRLFLSH